MKLQAKEIKESMNVLEDWLKDCTKESFHAIFGESMGNHLWGKFNDKNRNWLLWYSALDNTNRGKLSAALERKQNQESGFDYPLYEYIASKVSAIRNCQKSGNQEWEWKHRETLEKIERNLLPSGSGFDSGSVIDMETSKPEKIVINTSFHHMTETGYYSGWTDHSVIITPSLQFGFNLRVTGRNRNEIKDYIAETFQYVLSKRVEPETL